MWTGSNQFECADSSGLTGTSSGGSAAGAGPAARMASAAIAPQVRMVMAVLPERAGGENNNHCGYINRNTTYGSRRSTLYREAAVHRDRRAGDEIRGARGQEHGDAGEIFRRAPPPRRRARQHALVQP